MKIETVVPQSEKEWLELRTKNINSSEVAALFGFSPYSTAFELWHEKKEAKVIVREAEEWTKWGQRLQDAIAAGIAEEQGWKIRKMTEYMWDPVSRLGSSFDFSIEQEPSALGLLEVKNVFGMIFKEQWLEAEDGSVEAPPHIEIQVQHELLVSQRGFCYIGALIGGNKLELILRKADPEIQAAIIKKAAEFWKSIDDNIAPKPNFARDAEFIKKLYSHAEPGKIITADEEVTRLTWAYKEGLEEEKSGKAKKDAAVAEILTRIGEAEKVVGQGFTISAGLVGPAEIEAYTRKGYRLCKPNFSKVKK